MPVPSFHRESICYFTIWRPGMCQFEPRKNLFSLKVSLHKTLSQSMLTTSSAIILIEKAELHRADFGNFTEFWLIMRYCRPWVIVNFSIFLKMSERIFSTLSSNLRWTNFEHAPWKEENWKSGLHNQISFCIQAKRSLVIWGGEGVRRGSQTWKCRLRMTVESERICRLHFQNPSTPQLVVGALTGSGREVIK